MHRIQSGHACGHRWVLQAPQGAFLTFVACIVQGDEEEEETDNLVNQVLDEIGINLDEQMVAAPGQKAQVSIQHALLPCWHSTLLPCS